MSSELKRKLPSGGPAGRAEKKPKADGSITSFFGAPKITSSSTGKAASSMGSAAAAKFDKERWVAGLTPEQKELLALEIETLHPTWLAHLKEDLLHREFLELKRFLKREKEQGKTVFPKEEDVYSWSRYTPLPSTKAVILGQDPYHNVNQAHGLCFSVLPPTRAPPSLQNMYKALQRDYPTFRPPPQNSGLLTPWAEQGVLLLNTCLTVRAHEANSHAGRGWERFTGRVIEVVEKERRGGVVFLAWGSPAQKRVARVDKKKHCVLASVHPSPLSAARGFFDCAHFRKTNEWLKTRYGEDAEIDWSLGNSPPTLSSTTSTTTNKTTDKTTPNPLIPALTAAPASSEDAKAVKQKLEAAGETPAAAATDAKEEVEGKTLKKGNGATAGKNKAVDGKAGDEFEPDAEEEEALEEMMRSQE